MRDLSCFAKCCSLLLHSFDLPVIALSVNKNLINCFVKGIAHYIG